MTGQTLLNLMEVVLPEQQLQSGETDVTRGLLTLNAAQDLMETILAAQPDVLFGDTLSTITTVNSQEYTVFPTDVLRLDRLQFIDATTALPSWDIHNIRRPGGHAADVFWPWNLIATSVKGRPRKYWTNGVRIYWSPTPDGVYTIRWYGFQAAADITAAGTFAYPDSAALPLATLACSIIKTGLDDATTQLESLAKSLFSALLDMLRSYNRDMAPSYDYRYVHRT